MIQAETVMNWNTIGKHARGLSALWSMRPRLRARKAGAYNANRIYGAHRAQGSPAGTPQAHEHSGKPNELRAALNAWEDEGGRTAAPAKAAAIQ